VWLYSLTYLRGLEVAELKEEDMPKGFLLTPPLSVIFIFFVLTIYYKFL